MIQVALNLYASGMDLGDCLIAVLAPSGAKVATFDVAFISKAAAQGDMALPSIQLVSELVSTPSIQRSDLP